MINNLKFIIIIVTFNFIALKSFDSDCSEGDYNNFFELCIEVWTQIDLIRAINSSDEQKNIFLKEFIDHILNIYKQSDKLFTKKCLFNFQNKFEHAKSLLSDLKNSFEEVFENLSNLPEFIASKFILEKLILSLEVPIEIEV